MQQDFVDDDQSAAFINRQGKSSFDLDEDDCSPLIWRPHFISAVVPLFFGAVQLTVFFILLSFLQSGLSAISDSLFNGTCETPMCATVTRELYAPVWHVHNVANSSWFIAAVVLLIAARTVWKILVILTARVITEDEQIRIRTGVLNRDEEIMPWHWIRDATGRQPILLRIFGAGNIVLEGDDPSAPMVKLTGYYPYWEFRDVILTQMQKKKPKINVIARPQPGV